MTALKSEPPHPKAGRRVVSRREIAQIAGEISDVTAAAIVALGATQAELEEAAAWVSGDDDGLNRLRHQPTGIIAEICEILSAEGLLDVEQDERREPGA
jgi:hypothetical protein